MVIAGRKTAPGGGETAYKSYAVVSDAGVQGSKVHLYCFDENLDLLHIGSQSSFLNRIIEDNTSVFKSETTPVRVGATAGLRALGTATSEQILQAVEIPGCSLLMLLLVQEG
ncbi:hypothetical protein OPV22_001983 [Ensete ventricosum]|uniref:Uncharacterized protein n=1 Tax=Ensete ventricosum TaxID=4639 RepID=A0AAV8RWN0_ENSVE|nr:hypothetical protein OPV22_001983 [Ensete ventricosum]